MRSFVRLMAALALLAVQACSDSKHDSLVAAGTCSPGAHTTADPTGAEGYCVAYIDALCARVVNGCATQLGMGTYATAADCQAAYEPLCSYSDFSSDFYDSPCAGACLGYIARSACSAFASDPPQACDEATGPVASSPPSTPACIATIYAGTISDTIVVGDPLYDGSHSRTYCLSLTAGHSLTLETSAPLSGTEIYDTILYLLAPDGTLLTYDDDSGAAYYSRIYYSSLPATGTYKVIVTGYSSSDLGSYRLTVTAP